MIVYMFLLFVAEVFDRYPCREYLSIYSLTFYISDVENMCFVLGTCMKSHNTRVEEF